ncbi:MAG: hypothetical protein P9M14_01555 [Candidatus Alcyoniella australis]|nr:hypothetical protein [Candidatus Alcyoniella australis]
MNRISLLWVMVLLLLVCATAACEGSSDESDARGGSDNDADDDDDDDELPDECDNPFCVFQEYDLGSDWICAPGDEYGCSCYEDYEQFIIEAQQFAAPLPGGLDELLAQLDAIEGGDVPIVEGPLEPEEMRRIVLEALNVDFLIQGIDQRPLWTVIVSQEQQTNSLQQRIVFSDPYIGSFEALLAIPDDGEELPAIVVRHGHTEYPQGTFGQTFGSGAVRRGYVVLIPHSRALCGGDYERTTTMDLLIEGFTFQGLRYYETLLMHKYLRYLGWRDNTVDADALGLLGHSGGAASVNLSVRIDQGFAAFVGDFNSTYCWLDDVGRFLDDTVPPLWAYHDLINDYTTCPMPYYAAQYGELNNQDLWDFFEENLGQ